MMCGNKLKIKKSIAFDCFKLLMIFRLLETTKACTYIVNRKEKTAQYILKEKKNYLF